MTAHVAALLVVLPGLVCCAQEPQGLEAYTGKDLRNLDAGALREFGKRVEALTGDGPEEKTWREFKPWWVEPFASGRAAWMLLEAYPGYDNPDVSAVRVQVFDKDWKRLIKQAFPTGYRFFLAEATVVRDSPLGRDLLAAKTTSTGPFVVSGSEKRPAFEQGQYQRQYYAVLGDRMVLVRLEDDEGRLVRNHYAWSTPPKGPPVPRRTEEEWIRSLSSADPVEQLATLVWLSGTHLPSGEPRRENVDQESVEEARLFEAVRDAPPTRNALRKFMGSKNPWVREYAALTSGAEQPTNRRALALAVSVAAAVVLAAALGYAAWRRRTDRARRLPSRA